MSIVAPHIFNVMSSVEASAIRKMFEDGAALKKQHGDDAVFDFSLGNPDLPPPPAVIDAIDETARSRERGRHGYMPNAGYPETREAMAAKISTEQGVSVPASCVVMTAGAAAALNCVLKALLSPNDEILVPAPFFPDYAHYAKNHGGILRPILSRADFSLDIDAITQALSPKTAAVLINSPNNPSGKIYPESDIIALSAVLTAHGERCGRFPCLIIDEPYRAIVYGGKTVSPVFPHYRNSIVVSSFAKNLSIPGERIGYIAVNPDTDDAGSVVNACVFANRVLGFVNAPAFFQRVVAKSWNCPADYSSYQKRRDSIMRVLDDAGIAYAVPEGAFYIFCQVPVPANSAAGTISDDATFCNHLKNHLILCAPGASFGYRGWFRIAYCVPEKTIVSSAQAFKTARQAWM